MPKRPKGGPPYTDVPDEVYVVVTNPWGVRADNPRKRVLQDFNRVASWAQFALQHLLRTKDAPTVECIYSMGTRSELILQFSEGTDIIPLLGGHRWAEFSLLSGHQNSDQSTCVFLYNWTNNGDPANHNWTENFPISLNNVPAKPEYPRPSWIPPPSTLTNLVQPVPRPKMPLPRNGSNAIGKELRPVTSPPPLVSPAPPPPAEPSGSGEQPSEQELGSTDLFQPYQPPSQHPSHAQFLSQPETGDSEASKARPQSPKFVKKLDPYELEEDALNILRAPSPQQGDPEEADLKSTVRLSIKAEVCEVKIEIEDGGRNALSTSQYHCRYQPSQGLIDAFNSLRQNSTSSAHLPPAAHGRNGPNAVTQTPPPASSGYQPTAELEAEINALLRGKGSTTSSSPSSKNTQPMPIAGTRIAIKREYDDVTASLRERKKIKIEED